MKNIGFWPEEVEWMCQQIIGDKVNKVINKGIHYIDHFEVRPFRAFGESMQKRITILTEKSNETCFIRPLSAKADEYILINKERELVIRFVGRRFDHRDFRECLCALLNYGEADALRKSSKICNIA